jgi:hypothetical protein
LFIEALYEEDLIVVGIGAGVVRYGRAGRRDRVVRRTAADYILCVEEGRAGGEGCFSVMEERYAASNWVRACYD